MTVPSLDRLTFDEGLGLFVEEGTDHISIAKGALREYQALEIRDTDRVLDLGGHIGTFARLAGKAGAWVETFEPCFDSYSILLKNTEGMGNVTPYLGAVVPDFHPPGKLASIYTTKKHDGTGSAWASSLDFRGRTEYATPAFRIGPILSRLQPTVVKIDVEGAEYELFPGDLPPSVREVAFELHRNGRLEGLAEPFLHRLEASGFEIIDGSKRLLEQGIDSLGKMWHVTGVARRR